MLTELEEEELETDEDEELEDVLVYSPVGTSKVSVHRAIPLENLNVSIHPFKYSEVPRYEPI